jgi:hypothetical protein
MSLSITNLPILSNKLFVALATQDQVPEITDIINNAFWPSHKVFLDESNPKSKLRVSDEFISAAIATDDKEFYILFDAVNSLIVGTILLQKNVENEPNTAKFNLLVRNPKLSYYNGLKVGDFLMTYIIKRVEQLGKSILKIEVVDSCEDSNKLITYYKERGFAKTGKILDFPRKHCLKPNYVGKVCLVELQQVIAKSKI